jgi:uncharacterized protein YidB (DUF937 family)
MSLLEGLLGAVLGGQGGRNQPGLGGLGGLGDALSGRGQQGGASLITSLLPVLIAMMQRRGVGAGGLGGLLQQLQTGGLGQQVDSWVGTGANMPVSSEQIVDVLGHGRVSEIAARAGVSEEQASDGLAALLPELVNQLTPAGQVPAGNEVDDALGDLQRSLGI